MFKDFFIQSVKYWKEKSLMHAYIKLPIRGKSFQDKQIAKNKKTGKMFLLKSKKTEDWTTEVQSILAMLPNERSALRMLGRNFRPEEHALVCIWSFSYENNFTKDGDVNGKVPDLENGKKGIQDILINEMVGIDDRYVLCALERRITGNDGISLHLFLINRKSIDDIDAVI